MIKYFRDAIYTRSTVGELLLIQLKSLQIEAGIPNLLLEEPHIVIPYLSPTWITSMRQYQFNHNITITVTDVLQLTTQSSQDEIIMSAERLRFYSTSQQKDINLVRLYLQATTLADVTDNHDGLKISTTALSGIRSSLFATKGGWPRQELPSHPQQRLWRRYLASQFLRYEYFWKRAPRAKLRDGIKLPPEDACTLLRETTGKDDLVTDSRFYQSLPRSKKKLLSYVKQCATPEAIWESCHGKKQLSIASDGGLNGCVGTFGWNLSTHKNEVLFEGAGPIDGPFDVASSTRSELGGYVAPLLVLHILTQIWGMQHRCKLAWVCDSKAALSNVRKSTSRDNEQRYQPNNADFLVQIRDYHKRLRQPIKPIWIKGHQQGGKTTTKGGTRNIDRNNRADELATWYREQLALPQSTEVTDHIPESRITIAINGKRLVSRIEECIRYHVNGYHLRGYLQDIYKWSNSTWDLLDLATLGRFCRRMPAPNQTFHTKFVYNQLRVGTRRLQVESAKDPKLSICPCCRVHEENSDHLFQCLANPGRDQSFKDFSKTMSPPDPSPDVRDDQVRRPTLDAYSIH